MKDDRVYLEHIRDALNDIATYAGAGRDVFFAERMRQDACLRKLEVIGQAVKNLSDETKPASRRSRGSRSPACGTSHSDYFGVNLEIVWVVIDKELPRLADAINALLEM